MADNYLERHYEDYEKKKLAWLKKHKSNSSNNRDYNPWSD